VKTDRQRLQWRAPRREQMQSRSGPERQQAATGAETPH
jgi:hypothetical protein